MTSSLVSPPSPTTVSESTCQAWRWLAPGLPFSSTWRSVAIQSMPLSRKAGTTSSATEPSDGHIPRGACPKRRV